MHIRSLCPHLTLFAERDRFDNFSAIKTKELIFASRHFFCIEKKLLVNALSLESCLVIVLVGALWASELSGQPIERRIRRDSRQSAGNAGTAEQRRKCRNRQ